jgi:ADP-heptose:LPS heptosyltransferase
MKMSEQGATVLAYRAILRATELVGREHVYFWVFAENREILDLLSVIPAENVLTVRSDSFVVFLLDVIKTLVQIRRLAIDATVDLELLARAPAILAFLTGARRRAGMHPYTLDGPYRGDLLTHKLWYNPYLHTARSSYLLVEALLADPSDTPLLKIPTPPVDLRPPRLTLHEGHRNQVRTLIERLLGETVTSPIALLNPNASDLLPLRKWPTERFVELGRQLLARHPGLILVITGAPTERKDAEELTRAIGSRQAVSVAGRTTLQELLTLYTLATVLVTNDSGPAHFASLTGIDVVVLFGPETPHLYGPIGENVHTIWAGLACSPCVNAYNHRVSPCSNNRCMQTISVDQVLDEVEAILARHGLGPPPEAAVARGAET